MKLSALFTLGALSLVMVALPDASYAKEQSSSRSVVVGKSSNKSSSANHSSKKSHQGQSSHKKHNSHNNNHHKHKNYKGHHHSHSKHNHHRHDSWGSFVLGAAIGHSIGIHGAWYKGHPWCPSHHIYHTHSHTYSYSNQHYHHDGPRKIASYLELDEDGRCYRVSEYSNGDERRKRIRNHYCSELEEWDEWD